MLPTMCRPTSHILTVLPLLVLITLSFFVFFAEGTTSPSPDVVARHARQVASRRSLTAQQKGGNVASGNVASGDAAGDPLPSSSFSGAAKTTSSLSFFSSSTETSATSTSSSRSSSFLSSLTSTVSTSSSVRPSATSSSESSALTSSSTSSTTLSTISSTTSSPSSSTRFRTTSSSQSSSSSSSTSSSSSRTTLQITDIPISTATSVIIATNIQGALTSGSSASSIVQTTIEASSSEKASSNGFLSNTGAMAGTFTAVGIIAVGVISAIFIVLRKRRRSKELDIFNTEYKEYSSGNDFGGTSGGNGDYFASDMTSLSANAVSHAGAHTVEPDYNHVDYGLGLPPTVGATSNRTSMASNHAGYGAFRSAAERRKPPMQSSGLRAEAAWNSDVAYAEPAVDEDQSIYVVPNDHKSYYAGAVHSSGMSH